MALNPFLQGLLGAAVARGRNRFAEETGGFVLNPGRQEPFRPLGQGLLSFFRARRNQNQPGSAGETFQGGTAINGPQQSLTIPFLEQTGPPPGGSTGTDFSGLLDDTGVENLFNAGRSSIGEDRDKNTSTIEQGLALIAQGRIDLNDLFNTRREDLEGRFPVDPFTDEQFRQQQQTIFNDITAETRSLENQIGGNFADRGIGRGSSALEAGSLIQGQAIGSRARTTTNLQGQQRDFNQRSNEFRENLLSQLVSQQAIGSSGLSALEGQVRAGDQIDPLAISQLLERAGVADRGITLGQEQQRLDAAFIDQANNPATATGRFALNMFQAAFPDSPAEGAVFEAFLEWLATVSRNQGLFGLENPGGSQFNLGLN